MGTREEAPKGEQAEHVDNNNITTLDSIRASFRKQATLNLRRRRKRLREALDGWLRILGVLAGLRVGLVVFGEREVPGLAGVRRPADVVEHLRGLVENQE